MTEFPHQEFLFTVAEVAAAFVGFSLIVGILRPAEGAVRFLFLRDVAAISLIAVAGSFLPYVLFQFGVRGEPLWRASSGGLSLGWLTGVAFANRRFTAVGAWKVVPTLFVFGSLINLGGIGSLLWSVVVGGSLSGPRYALALSLLLAIAGLMFIWAAFQRSADQPAV